MTFLRGYLRNLLLIALVLVGMLIFMRVFYPDTLAVLPLMGEIYSALNLWPLLILVLLVLALPRRRRR